MVAHAIDNVAVQTKQRPSRVVTWILPYYDVRRKEQAKWFSEPEVFPQAQRASLLVVVGSGPAYVPGNDVHPRQARVFVTSESTVVTKSWQTAPFGSVGYSGDVQRWPQAKYFPDIETFPQAQFRSARVVTDYSQGNADIFHGQDTYGWPPAPIPEYWSPETRGTRTILQNFTAYDFAHDIIGRRGNARFFEEPQTFTRLSQPITGNVLNFLYNAAIDVTRLRSQAKYFEDAPLFWRQPQPITGNILKFFPTYNPATDVIRLRRPERIFEEIPVFWRNQTITLNATTVYPAPPSPPKGYGYMPYLIGYELWEALQLLYKAGILSVRALGYFGTFPITVVWAKSNQEPGIVLAQSISSGVLVKLNSPITLTVSEFAVSVAFP